jgi:ABC-type transport system involved in multi-copper enzyme maturation permease subunit
MNPVLRAVRSELIKLRRPRVLYGSLGALLGFTVLVSVLTVATAVDRPEAGQQAVPTARLAEASGLTVGFSNASRLVGVVVLLLFLTAVTGEYGIGTLRTLLVRQPRRAVFLAGKLGALLIAMTAALAVALLVGMAAATVTAQARGLPTAAWFTGAGLACAAGTFGNTVLACAVYGAVGLAFGVLLRSTVLAVGVMLGWFVMAENIADNTWPDAGHWLPGLLAGAVMQGGTDTVSYQYAAVGSLGCVVVALAVAMVVFVRRDVPG